MSKRVISNKNLPARAPLYQTLVAGLVLDRFHAPGWVWGCVATLFLLIWIATIGMWKQQTEVELRELG